MIDFFKNISVILLLVCSATGIVEMYATCANESLLAQWIYIVMVFTGAYVLIIQWPDEMVKNDRENRNKKFSVYGD